MATRRRPTTPARPTQTAPTLSAGAGRERLTEQQSRGRTIVEKQPLDEGAYDGWKMTTRAVLVGAFGEGSTNVDDFDTARAGMAAHVGADRAFWNRYYTSEMEARLRVIASAIEQLAMGLGSSATASASSASFLDDLAEQLAFVETDALALIMRRDVSELQRALIHEMHKAALLLTGSILEAVLVEVLDRRRDLAQSHLPKRAFPEGASLLDLIAIAGTEGFLSQTATQMATALVDHRDLIHPHAEIRARLRIDEPTAHAAVQLLRLVVRDLAAANADGRIKAYIER